MTDPSDNTLISNIKNNINSDESLNILYKRHSGIYYKMINSHIPKGASFADKEELICDNYHMSMDCLRNK